jgi:hypothetical protein
MNPLFMHLLVTLSVCIGELCSAVSDFTPRFFLCLVFSQLRTDRELQSQVLEE